MGDEKKSGPGPALMPRHSRGKLHETILTITYIVRAVGREHSRPLSTQLDRNVVRKFLVVEPGYAAKVKTTITFGSSRSVSGMSLRQVPRCR
jgi:hypothetical protein